MDLIGRRVIHKKFGEGIITQQDASQISVKFAAEDAAKRFLYPSCFKTFLKLSDADIVVQAEAAVKQHEEQEHKKKQQAIEEVEARRFARKLQEGSSKSAKTAELRPFDISYAPSYCRFCKPHHVQRSSPLRRGYGAKPSQPCRAGSCQRSCNSICRPFRYDVGLYENRRWFKGQCFERFYVFRLGVRRCQEPGSWYHHAVPCAISLASCNGKGRGRRKSGRGADRLCHGSSVPGLRKGCYRVRCC